MADAEDHAEEEARVARHKAKRAKLNKADTGSRVKKHVKDVVAAHERARSCLRHLKERYLVRKKEQQEATTPESIKAKKVSRVHFLLARNLLDNLCAAECRPPGESARGLPSGTAFKPSLAWDEVKALLAVASFTRVGVASKRVAAAIAASPYLVHMLKAQCFAGKVHHDRVDKKATLKQLTEPWQLGLVYATKSAVACRRKNAVLLCAAGYTGLDSGPYHGAKLPAGDGNRLTDFTLPEDCSNLVELMVPALTMNLPPNNVNYSRRAEWIAACHASVDLEVVVGLTLAALVALRNKTNKGGGDDFTFDKASHCYWKSEKPSPDLKNAAKLRLLLAVIDSKSFPPMLAALCNVGTMVTISSCVEDGDERREAVDALRAELSKTAATLESNDTSATTAMEDLPESSAAAYTGDSDVGDSDEDFGEDNDSSDADAAGAAQ